MDFSDTTVAFDHCTSYADCPEIIDTLCSTLPLRLSAGSTVLVKPNLVAARHRFDLACTNPRFVRAVIKFLLNHGLKVLVGDSPAFTSAIKTMSICGLRDLLEDLPVTLVNFSNKVSLHTSSGFPVTVERAALECDTLVNLPKLKAHGQFLVSLAVKNFFGIVMGWQKPLLHIRHHNDLPVLITDLLQLLPETISLVDGITAMHKTGPTKGEGIRLSLLAGSTNPVALDTALLNLLNIPAHRSPLWTECSRRGYYGSRLMDCNYSMKRPEDFQLPTFLVPEKLQPIRFNPFHVIGSIAKRLAP